MTFHFPEEVATNLLTIDAVDPVSGTAEFKAAAIRIEPLPRPAAAGHRRRSPSSRGSSVARWTSRFTAPSRRAKSAPPWTSLLGAATSGWEGAARDIERDGRAAHGGRAARDRRDLLLPALHAVQDRVGWVSEGALNYICQRLTVPPADAWGVVTFYHLFATEPRAARGGPCLRRPRLPLARRREDLRPARGRARSGRTTAARRRRHVAAQPLPRALRARPRGARRACRTAARDGDVRPGRRRADDRPRARGRHHRALHRSRGAARSAPAFGAAGRKRRRSGSWHGSVPSIQRASTPIASPAATGLSRGRSSSGRRGSSPSSPPRSSSGAAAPPFRRGASGRRWRAPRRRSAM